MDGQRRAFITGITLIITIALGSCETGFTPHVTPLILGTAPPGLPFTTAAPPSTQLPALVGGTAEAENPLVPETFIGPAPSRLRRGDPSILSYEKVACGTLEGALCYELCSGGECQVQVWEDPRIKVFVDAVDRHEEMINKWTIAEQEARRGRFEAFGKCVAGLGAAAGAYAAVTAINPEPITKTVMALTGGVAALAFCGSSLIGTNIDAFERDYFLSESERSAGIADEMHLDLQINPPE